MVKKYEVTGTVLFYNRLAGLLARLGLGPDKWHILTVRGRKTGRLYSTPVSLVEEGGKRWLVSPYGEVSWVKNARAAGEVSLSRGGKSETVRLIELAPQESAPVLKQYLARESFPRPYFDVPPDASLDAFVLEAPRHPVFRLIPKSGDGE